MSFEQTSRRDAQRRGPGWRRLPVAVPVDCYLAGVWMTQPVSDVNDETSEVRIAYDTVSHGVVHVILDVAAYRGVPDLFGST